MSYRLYNKKKRKMVSGMFTVFDNFFEGFCLSHRKKLPQKKFYFIEIPGFNLLIKLKYMKRSFHGINFA